MFLGFNSHRIKGCHDCRALKVCGGGCYWVNYHHGGGLYKPCENLCKFARLYYDVVKPVYDEFTAEKNEFFENTILRPKKGKRQAENAAAPAPDCPQTQP